MKPRESPIRVWLRINCYRDTRRAQLRHHGIETTNPEINHPECIGGTEVGSVLRKRRKYGRPGPLFPRCLSVACRNLGNAKVIQIPLAKRRRVARAKEESTDSEHFFHVGSGFFGLPLFQQGAPYSALGRALYTIVFVGRGPSNRIKTARPAAPNGPLSAAILVRTPELPSLQTLNPLGARESL